MTLIADSCQLVQNKKLRNPAQVWGVNKCKIGVHEVLPVLELMCHPHHIHTTSTLAHQVYLTCMELLGRLAGKGLVHCDFNE